MLIKYIGLLHTLKRLRLLVETLIFTKERNTLVSGWYRNYPVGTWDPGGTGQVPHMVVSLLY